MPPSPEVTSVSSAPLEVPSLPASTSIQPVLAASGASSLVGVEETDSNQPLEMDLEPPVLEKQVDLPEPKPEPLEIQPSSPVKYSPRQVKAVKPFNVVEVPQETNTQPPPPVLEETSLQNSILLKRLSGGGGEAGTPAPPVLLVNSDPLPPPAAAMETSNSDLTKSLRKVRLAKKSPAKTVKLEAVPVKTAVTAVVSPTPVPQPPVSVVTPVKVRVSPPGGRNRSTAYLSRTEVFDFTDDEDIPLNSIDLDALDKAAVNQPLPNPGIVQYDPLFCGVLIMVMACV